MLGGFIFWIFIPIPVGIVFALMIAKNAPVNKENKRNTAIVGLVISVFFWFI
ncbi:hypothetical protein [Alteribacter keqinensis]|uniref:hypothetical protein n=1 Tax=Alteribacter keqinensis TaxID=2483800 RepID=UPI001605DF17|nr:hypothetical protein [Alteribacter keqinensis]